MSTEKKIDALWPLSQSYEYTAELGLGLRLALPGLWKEWAREDDFPLPQAAGYDFFKFLEQAHEKELRRLLPHMLREAPGPLQVELEAAASQQPAKAQPSEGLEAEEHNWLWHPDIQGRTLFQDRMHSWTEKTLGSGEAVGAAGAELHQITRVHSPSYIESLYKQSGAREAYLTPETVLLQGDRDRLAAAAGLAVYCAERVLEDGLIFMETRPGSHHASSAKAGGTCFVNNLAISAAEALRRREVGRVALLDIDAHHGNGSEEIFRLRRDVYTISLHQSPPWFPGTGVASYKGEGDGHGYNLNLPCSDREEWMRSWDKTLAALRSYRPDLLLLELSADAHRLDPASDLDLEDEDFFFVGESLGKIGLPLLAELGSSLSEEAWSHSLAAFLRGWKSA